MLRLVTTQAADKEQRSAIKKEINAMLKIGKCTPCVREFASFFDAMLLLPYPIHMIGRPKYNSSSSVPLARLPVAASFEAPAMANLVHWLGPFVNPSAVHFPLPCQRPPSMGNSLAHGACRFGVNFGTDLTGTCSGLRDLDVHTAAVGSLAQANIRIS
jgi:hypothetical protein